MVRELCAFLHVVFLRSVVIIKFIFTSMNFGTENINKRADTAWRNCSTFFSFQFLYSLFQICSIGVLC